MQSRRFTNALIHALTDALAVAVAFVIAAIVSGISLEESGVRASCAVYITIAVFLMKMYDFYDIDYISKRDTLISVCLVSVMTSVGGLILCALLGIANGSAPFFFLMTAVLAVLLNVKWNLVSEFASGKYKGKHALFIEAHGYSSLAVRKLRYTRSLLSDSVYVIVDDKNKEEVDALVRLVDKYDLVYMSDNVDQKVRNTLLRKLVRSDKTIFLYPDISSTCISFGKFIQFDDVPMISGKHLGFTKLQCFVKRSFDLVCSAAGLVVLSPLFAIIAVAVKLDSPGPVFYKQSRLTKNEKEFFVYKFRSMRNDAESSTGAVFAAENDPRITRVGHFLRAVRLDEMPQLLNIIKGDMSIVGPRPERGVFVEKFKEQIPSYSLRYVEKAGLTGYAQVYGKYNTTTFDKTVMDVLYINHASLLLDLKLILLTLKIIFIRESTAGVYNMDFENDVDMDKAREQSKRLLFGDGIKVNN